MFNWFKKKIELKNEKSVMSSIDYKKGIKIGSEIVVPSNFECLVYNKGKHFITLSSGKHKIDKTTFSSLMANQEAKKSSKYINFVAHYISLSNQKLEIRFKKKKFIVEFCIDNSVNFAQYLLLYTYKVDSDYTYCILVDTFKELLLYHKGDYSKISANTLSNYGIKILNFAPSDKKCSIFDKSTSSASKDVKILSTEPTNTPTQNTSIPQNTQAEHSKIEAPQVQSLQSSPQPSPQSFPKCPKCGNVVKFATTYCLKCGHKLSQS
ncbi:MAG: hypothetical protein IJ358_02265 [Clostridia bacterium]|nr:hypothetical protein [Clostridia bacterium]